MYGIDYYLVNSSVWKHFQHIYGSDMECVVNESSLDLPRPRLPTNASLSDSEIQVDDTPTEAVTIKIGSKNCSEHPLDFHVKLVMLI